MKNILLIFIFINTILSATQDIKDPYKDIEYFVLDNGMQVYMLSDSRASNTSIEIDVKVGWDIENENTYGISHLVEHIAFRDQRIPYKDYFDYFEKNGATDVNAQTKRYVTEYYLTINKEKSYWAIENFSNMFFDKKITDEDLLAEKGALQVEIGQNHIYSPIIYRLSKIKYLAPEVQDEIEAQFELTKLKEYPNRYILRKNNEQFSLTQVLSHYNDYYYPKNMILKIGGNFNNSKMKSLIISKFGSISKSGSKTVNEPSYSAKINGQPYENYEVGSYKNYGYIGTKYVFKDMEQYIVLDSYMDYVSKKIQQNLRNSKGQSYTIDYGDYIDRGGGAFYITFDGLGKDFEKNIKIVQKELIYYSQNINESIAKEALNEYKKIYISAEYDSESLMDRLDMAHSFRDQYKIYDKTHYEIFSSISPETYKKIIKETFKPTNNYIYIGREYYFFPFDTLVLVFGIVAFFIVANIFAMRHKYPDLFINKHKIITIRLSNILIGFFTNFSIFFLTILSLEWIKYFMGKYIDNHFFYIDNNIMPPYNYLVEIIYFILFVLLFILIYTKIANYYYKLFIAKDKLYIFGSKIIILEKQDIVSIEKVKWSIDKYFKIKGSFFRFWKPLLEIKAKEQTFYLRINDADAIKQLLENDWLNKK